MKPLTLISILLSILIFWGERMSYDDAQLTCYAADGKMIQKTVNKP